MYELELVHDEIYNIEKGIAEQFISNAFNFRWHV